MDDIALMIQKVARESNEASAPTNIVLGTVESVSPLEIKVDQKLVLNEMQLLLTRNVIDYELEMTVDHFTEDTSGGSGDAEFASHNHAYKGKKKFLIHNELKVGEDVIMIRNKGGQLYVVIDKVVKP